MTLHRVFKTHLYLGFDLHCWHFGISKIWDSDGNECEGEWEMCLGPLHAWWADFENDPAPIASKNERA